jgi:predicted HTH domain antitoxin
MDRMTEGADEAVTVAVPLPRDALRHHPWNPVEIGRDMRALWLVEQVRERRLGYGKAAQLADMPLAAFLDLMGRHHVSPFDFDPSELATECQPLP